MILVEPARGKRGEPAINEDDGCFQAFALMDGHDLDGGAVGLEALNVAILAGGLACFLDIGAQRRDQVGQLAAGGPRVFQQDLEKVQVIRQRPLIVLEEQLPANDAAVIEDLREQRLEATPAGEVVPLGAAAPRAGVSQAGQPGRADQPAEQRRTA